MTNEPKLSVIVAVWAKSSLAQRTVSISVANSFRHYSARPFPHQKIVVGPYFVASAPRRRTP